ncbi:MAG: glycolate oxidase subunit GlcE [Halocynthiibacter sp.]
MSMPKTEQELSEMVIAAKDPVWVQGVGSHISAPKDMSVLSTAALSGVTLYEPGALTLVAQAGTPIDEIETLLKSENQRLAFEPPKFKFGGDGASTLGGVCAMNLSGPRRISVGACRDFMLGVRFVDGAGRVLSNGGRVMKNVTGYDIVKLMSGSHGTLGVMTEISLKVLPDVEETATLAVHGLDIEGATKTMARAMGSPFEVSGAAYLMGTVYLRVEGFSQSVAYRIQSLKALISGADMEVVPDPKTLWSDLRDVTALSEKEGDLWRVSIKPSDAPEVAARLSMADLQFDWAGGLVWAQVPRGTDLRGVLMGISGHATLMRGDGTAQSRFQPEAKAVAKLSAALRARFDPRGILNQGLMG